MKTRRTITLATTLCMAWVSQGQDWNANPGGNVIIGGEWLGAAATSTIPLHLRTIPDLSIDFSTSNLLRMRLNPNQTPTINNFTVPTNGFLGLSGNPNFFNGVGPFSRLHLADNAFGLNINAQEFGFRTWQRNGITFTGNADHSYIGQKFNGLDNTDLVLLWSNDPGTGQFLNLCRVSRRGPCTSASFHPDHPTIRAMLLRHEFFKKQVPIPQFGPYIRSA